MTADGASKLTEPGATLTTASEAKERPAGSVAFRNVSFGYGHGNDAVHDLDLFIPAGQKVGIVGPSGAGKSTFINLLQRLYDVQKGDILVGGKPLDENKTYTLATSDFLVSRGGDGYTMFKDAKILIKVETAPKDSELFENAIRNAPNKTIAPKVEGRIVKVNR